MESTTKILQFEVAEIQLSYKTQVKPSQRPKISSSKDAYSILLESWDDEKLEFVEQFKILLLNRANRGLGFYKGILCGEMEIYRVILPSSPSIGFRG
jgi:DNA repair protein RadC